MNYPIGNCSGSVYQKKFVGSSNFCEMLFFEFPISYTMTTVLNMCFSTVKVAQSNDQLVVLSNQLKYAVRKFELK